jgi:hypothetical protein
VLTDHVGVASQRRAKPLDGWQLRVRLDPRAEGLDQGLEAGDVETLLALEVLEDQAVGDPGGLGDLVDRDLVVVAIAEGLQGRREEL